MDMNLRVSMYADDIVGYMFNSQNFKRWIKKVAGYCLESGMVLNAIKSTII